MSRRLQPSVPLVTLIKTEPPTVIKSEPPEEALEKEIGSDIKNIDIVYHSLSEDLIKSEIVPENILETKYLESVETQILVKTEDTSDENVTRDTNQEVIAVQGSYEHSNTLSDLETHKQFVLNSSKDLNGIGAWSRKAKHVIKTDFARCYKTDEITSWVKDKEKIKVIKAPDIPVEANEYTSLANGKHVCNHCQHTYNALSSVKLHIKRMHREVTTMYQCPYCPYKSKWTLHKHIIQKHKDAKDIKWFQCHLCEKKFKLKCFLTQHIKVHLTHEQMQDLKRYHCNNCDYKTDDHQSLKRHNLVHLKPEEIEYSYCYHCSNKFKRKYDLKIHFFRQHFKNVKQLKRYHCDTCDYKTYTSSHLKVSIFLLHLVVHMTIPFVLFSSHKLTHLKPEEIQYFYCYHCSYKAKHKEHLKRHIFTLHFKKNVKQRKRYGCNKCNYETYTSTLLKGHNLVHLKPEEIDYFYCYHCSHKSKQKSLLRGHIFRLHFRQEKRFGCNKCNYKTNINANLKTHKLIHLKPEEIQYFFCYHCSYKGNQKGNLKQHIFTHFKKEQVEFHCYICNFMTQKRELIIAHIKKHSKVQNKSEINEES